MAKCIDHYSTIFNTSDYIPNFRAIRPDHTPNSRCHSLNTPLSSILPNIPSCPTFDEGSLLGSGLLDTVTTDKIKVQLGRMSSTSSCGSDGITINVNYGDPAHYRDPAHPWQPVKNVTSIGSSLLIIEIPP